MSRLNISINEVKSIQQPTCCWGSVSVNTRPLLHRCASIRSTSPRHPTVSLCLPPSELFWSSEERDKAKQIRENHLGFIIAVASLTSFFTGYHPASKHWINRINLFLSGMCLVVNNQILSSGWCLNSLSSFEYPTLSQFEASEDCSKRALWTTDKGFFLIKKWSIIDTGPCALKFCCSFRSYEKAYWKVASKMLLRKSWNTT